MYTDSNLIRVGYSNLTNIIVVRSVATYQH